MSRALVVGLTVVVGACGGATDRTGVEGASARRGTQVWTDEALRVAFRPPGTGWTVVPEDEAHVANADAVLIARDGARGMSGSLVVELALTDDLETLGQMAFDLMPFDNKQLERVERVRFQGHDAVRMISTMGSSDALERVAHLVFVHQDHAYRITVSGLVGRVAQDGSSFTPFFDAFEILPGPIRPAPRHPDVRAARGVDWRVTERVWESAAYGLRIAPGPNWRTRLPEDLETEGVVADVGFVSTDPPVTVHVRTSWRNGLTPDDRLEGVVQALLDVEGMERQVGEPELRIGDRRASVARFRGETRGLIEFLIGDACFEDVCVNVTAIYPSRISARAIALLQSDLPAPGRLDATARESLEADLRAHPPESTDAGPGWSILGGTWSSFPLGTSWQCPASGVWDFVAGDRAHAHHAGAALYALERTQDIVGIVAEHPSSTDEAALHRQVLTEAGAVVSADPPTPLLLGSLKALVSRAGIEAGTCRIATLLRPGATSLEIRFCATSASKLPVLDEAIRGFRVEAPSTEVVSDGDVTTDRQFGWRFEPPALGWRRTVEGGDAGAMVRGVTWQGPDWGAAITCLRFDRGRDPARIRDTFLARVSESLELDHLTPVATDDVTLAGHPARHRSFRGEPLSADVHMVIRGQVLCTVVETRGSGVPPAFGGRLRFLP